MTTIIKYSERCGTVSVPLGAVLPIMSNLPGSHVIPVSGTADSTGFQLCDGSVIPTGCVLSGNTPDLSDGRFLMGNVTAGSTGGANHKTLTISNLPSHTHDMADHTHTGVTGIETGHEHTTLSSPASGVMGTAGGGADPTMSYVDSSSTPDTGWQHDHGHTLITAGPNNNTTTATGSGSTFDNRPSYMTVQYLIRVS